MEKNNWPKIPPQLSPAQLDAREKFVFLWHKELPSKYSIIERFNHESVARLPVKQGSVTLEVGAGLGAHSKFEDLQKQDYYCLEYREEFCRELKKRFSPDHVIHGDIEKKQKWDDEHFDRIVAIHVLEHLRNLPKAVEEIKRLLKPDGYLDVVLPCEGSFLYSLARKISAERLFKKNFKMEYTPIIQNEHVSTYAEIKTLLTQSFEIESSSYFPLKVPVVGLNLVIALRLKKKVAA